MNEEKRENDIHSSPRGDLPRLNVKDLLLSLAAVLLCGCVLSGAIPSEWMSLASAILFVYTVIAVRNAGAVIQILLASLIVTGITFLPVGGAVVLALIHGTGTLAWLFMVLPKYKWAPIGLLAAAYGLGVLVTANAVAPLFALAFLPAAVLMAWAHARDIGRTNTVLHTLLGFLIVALASLCVILWRTYGSINYDVLLGFVNELKTLFVTITTEMSKMFWETLEAVATPSALASESWEEFRTVYETTFSESSLRQLADYFMGLAPALVGVPTLILSYLANVVLLRKYYNTEWRAQMTPAACSLTVSPATGVIYFVCFLIAMFVEEQSVFLMAVSNMYFLLMPCLCLTGVNAILQNARRARGWMGVTSILFLVAVVCCMGTGSFYFVALWGAYVTVSNALHQKILQKMKEQDDNKN